MVPNTSLHTVKVGIGLVSQPAKTHWLLGPPATTLGHRLAQRMFLAASVAWLVWLMLWIDGLFS